MVQWKFLLFGSPRLQRDNQPVALNRRKALALLAYLAVTHRLQSREALATLLWPEQDQSKAMTNLRGELYQLRKLLGQEVLQIEQSQIGLKQPSLLWLDVTRFRERLAVAQQHDHPPGQLCATCARALAEAVTLYTEDFMTGFNLPDNLAFDEWQFFQTESLRRSLARTLQQLIAWHSEQGQTGSEEAIAYARRWLALDELHEPAHRQLMWLYALTGQQAAALRQYDICRRLLKDELDVAPESATQELAEAIKARRFPTTQETETLVSLPPSTLLTSPYHPPFLDNEAPMPMEPPLFVARENELALLTAALKSARAGQVQLLFVIGGAGRGKTMLVQEFARRAQAADPELIVVSGACKTHTGIGDPYLPFREALEMLTGDVEAIWAGGLITTAHARRLWQLMPLAVSQLVEHGSDLLETFVGGSALLRRAAAMTPANSPWLQRLEALVKAPDLRPLQQKHIFAQMTAVLNAIAAERPLLLILEDLHWADTASISLLFHLSRSMADSRMIIAGTYRPDEVATGWGEEGHPLAHITGELKRQHGDIWLDLGDEMAALEGRRFVEAYLDSQPNRLDETFRQALFAHTGGHALFTVELLRDMRERGDLRKDEAGYWMAGETIDWQTLPARVEGVIEQRMQRLDAALKSTLSIASVEGETFTAEVVAQIQGADERELVRRLSQDLDKKHRLVTAQALERLAGQRLSIYQFRHNLFQHYLYHSLAETERAYLHEAVGESLETTYASQPEKVAVRLAYHFKQAGLTGKAVDYLLQAGRQASLLSANEEAIDHFRQGLALLQTLPQSEARNQQELELQIALAMSLTASQGYAAPEVQQAFERARALVGQTGETPQLASILFGMCRFYVARGQHQTADELGEQLLQLVSPREDPLSLISAHYALVMTTFYLGQFRQSLDHSEYGLACYQPEQHRSLALRHGQDPKVTFLGYRSWALWFLGYPDQGRHTSESAVSFARGLGHAQSLAHALGLASSYRVFCRKGEEGQALADELLALASEYEFALWRGFGGIWLGGNLAVLGQYQASITTLNESWAITEATGAGMFRPFCLGQLAEAYRGIGKIEKAFSVLDEALEVAEITRERYYNAEIYRLQGELLLTNGTAAEAEAKFQQAIEVTHRQQAKSLELRSVVSLARLWQSQGKGEEARQMLSEIYNWFTEGFDTDDLQEAKALLEELS